MSEVLVMPKMRTDDPTRAQEAAHLNAILYGGKCLGYASVTFDDTAEVALPAIPAGADIAIAYLEAGVADVGKARVARYREDGVAPTAAAGMPLGDDGIYEISGRGNIDDFLIIGINAGVTHTLRVQYYGQG